MNEHDPLEVELASIKPRQASRELKHRVAQKLQQSDRPSLVHKQFPARRGWQLSFALAIALVVLAMIRMLPRRPHSPPGAPSSPIAIDLAQALDPALPTVWTYHRAV